MIDCNKMQRFEVNRRPGWRIKIDIKIRTKQSFQYSRFGGGYTKASTKNYENHLKDILNSAWNSPPISGAVQVNMFFFFKKFKTTKQKLHGFYHTAKKDLDNLSKGVNDAAKGIIFEDDSLVSAMHLEKLWAEKEDYIVLEFIHLGECV